MGTRAVYSFKDAYHNFHVYKHWDGDEEGAAEFLANAFPYAWGGKRFEAMDFAAAFVAGNKKQGGGDVYFTKSPSHHGDLSFGYQVYQDKKNQLRIRAYKYGWLGADHKKTRTKFYDDTLDSFIFYYGTQEVAESHSAFINGKKDGD